MKREVDAGNEVAVVVSAMAGVTNQLVGWCREASPLHDPREYDVVVATGEQVTTGLLAIALQAAGREGAVAGWAGRCRSTPTTRTARRASRHRDDAAARSHGARARSRWCRASRACRPNGRVTTLGRGGSDTSAVALAAALKADRCDIYTDVDGVYTTDPRIVPRARKLERITYEEMLELASLGAKVLQTRSVELAMKHRVRVQVLSSFERRARARWSWMRMRSWNAN